MYLKIFALIRTLATDFWIILRMSFNYVSKTRGGLHRNDYRAKDFCKFIYCLAVASSAIDNNENFLEKSLIIR
jgi:hypothetical protein